MSELTEMVGNIIGNFVVDLFIWYPLLKGGGQSKDGHADMCTLYSQFLCIMMVGGGAAQDQGPDGCDLN